MSMKYDPSISSACYLEIARKRARAYGIPQIKKVQSILEYDHDFGVDQLHVERLLDHRSWSDVLVREGRKPRVFMDAVVNQLGNAEIRCVGGSQGIVFTADFDWEYLANASPGTWGANRSLGELAWFKDYQALRMRVILEKCTVSKAVLFGFKARLAELRQQLAAEVELVGAMEIELSYARNNVSAVDFEFSVPYERVIELRNESRGASA